MVDPALFELLRDAMFVTAVVVAPPVIASTLGGIAIGILQAVTQVQDQALSLAVRIVTVFGTLAVFGPWAFEQVARFAHQVLTGVEFY